MRTTLTLRDDLHARLVSLSRDRRSTVSRTVEELLLQALDGAPRAYDVRQDPRTGLVSIDLGRMDEDDVRSLDDE